VASSFRILRQLLERVEDSRTGQILPRDFHVEIPRERMAEAREVAKVLGTEVYDRFPFPPGGVPVSTDPYELILNNTWRPALAITGAAGLPMPADGGNVLRPRRRSSSRCACRRTCEAGRAVRKLKSFSKPIRRTARRSRWTRTATRATGGTRRPPIPRCSNR